MDVTFLRVWRIIRLAQCFYTRFGHFLQANHIDIAPNFAGTLMGLTNCAANIMSIIAPLLVGYIVTDESQPDQWRIVFWISAGVYFFGNLLFVLFSSTEIQVWNDPDHRDRRMFLFYDNFTNLHSKYISFQNCFFVIEFTNQWKNIRNLENIFTIFI